MIRLWSLQRPLWNLRIGTPSFSLLRILSRISGLYSEISKGRCRAQSCKATLELPSLLPKKLTGECSVREIFNLLLIFCGEVLLKSMILGPDSSVRLKVQVGQIMDLLLIAQPV